MRDFFCMHYILNKQFRLNISRVISKVSDGNLFNNVFTLKNLSCIAEYLILLNIGAGGGVGGGGGTVPPKFLEARNSGKMGEA